MAPSALAQASALRPRLQPMSVQARITRLKAARLTLKEERYPSVAFDIHAELRQVKRSGPGILFSYRLVLEALPSAQRAEIEGEALVQAPWLEEVELEELGEEELGRLALEVYRSLYEPLYLLFDTMELSSPPAWLVKDVSLVA